MKKSKRIRNYRIQTTTIGTHDVQLVDVIGASVTCYRCRSADCHLRPQRRPISAVGALMLLTSASTRHASVPHITRHRLRVSHNRRRTLSRASASSRHPPRCAGASTALRSRTTIAATFKAYRHPRRSRTTVAATLKARRRACHSSRSRHIVAAARHCREFYFRPLSSLTSS